MKKARMAKILELIEKFDIDTQEEMQQRLSDCGFEVTQATVSRDIKELKLTKVISESGKHKYISSFSGDKDKQDRLDAIFKSSIISADYALNTVVIKCGSGMAQAACAAFDAMNFDDVLGTIAGDDTIFVLMRTENSASKLTKNLIKLGN
ncbi:MAG: arginine repressor [Oscillospiraceae bacterium]|nr:arginine repressor [Oscillospiraceae bacterium]